MKIRLFIIFILIILQTSAFAKSKYFQEGINLFEKNKFDEAKFKFEQDIVLNRKNELSYLYLSKIFKKINENNLEDENLNTVILLNPKNEEAVYNLAKLKLSTSDYKKSNQLNEKLKSICVNFCSKSDKLKIEIQNLLKK